MYTVRNTRSLIGHVGAITAAVMLLCSNAFAIAQYSASAGVSVSGETDSSYVSFVNYDNTHNVNADENPPGTNGTASATAITAFSGQGLTASVGANVSGNTGGDVVNVSSSSEAILNFDILYAPEVSNTPSDSDSVLVTLYVDVTSSQDASVGDPGVEEAGSAAAAYSPWTSVTVGDSTSWLYPVVNTVAEVLGFQTTIELFAFQNYSVRIGAGAKGYAQATEVPEPGTMLLLASGLLGAALRRRV